MALDSFYEESAKNLNEKKQSLYYTISHIAQIVFIVLACIWGWFGTMFVIEVPVEGKTFADVLPSWIFFALTLCSIVIAAVAISVVKKRFNISYDYVCVYGELRISKVVNQRKRKLIARIDPNAIIQVGDVDSSSYDRIRSMPGIKETICTANDTSAEGKFFMYVYAQVEGGKRLYLLECREALLINLMQYLRRDILDRDYVPQDKKM